MCEAPPSRTDPLYGSDELRVYPNWRRSCSNLNIVEERFSLVLTVFLIVGPVAVFCAFVARKLIDDHCWGLSVMVIALVFTCYDLILLFLLTSARTHYRKHVFFFMFVVSTILLCVYVFCFCWVYIKQIMVNYGMTSVWRAMTKTPASIVLIVYTFLASCFVGGFAAFRLYLITTNQISRVPASHCPEASTPPQTQVCLVYLPWDITTEILSRLPVKSLMRFKCVSKSFRGLISNDPHFKTRHNLYHRRHHESSLKILVPHCKSQEETAFSCSVSSLTPGDNTIHELQLPIGVGFPTYMNGRFHNSCNGLFCVQVCGGGVFIWNPSTKQVRELPRFQHLVELFPHRTMYSLAHDSRSDIYKLLGIFKCSYSLPYRICFYSSEMGTWRDVKGSSCCDYVGYDVNPTVANGAFHWLGNRVGCIGPRDVVVSFDISDETYGSFALPRALGTKFPMLCALKGKLCFFTARNRSESYRELWVMNEYGVADSVTRMFCVSCVELPDPSCRPLCMLEDDTVVIYGHGRTSFYKDGRFVCGTSVGTSFWFALAHVYLESLISPHEVQFG